jgi:hypothetical protein
VVGENTGSNSGALLWENSELALEENILSKWHGQGVSYSESAGSIIHSEIDRKRYNRNILYSH